jgi:hypothetical protein
MDIILENIERKPLHRLRYIDETGDFRIESEQISNQNVQQQEIFCYFFHIYSYLDRLPIYNP